MNLFGRILNPPPPEHNPAQWTGSAALAHDDAASAASAQLDPPAGGRRDSLVHWLYPGQRHQPATPLRTGGVRAPVLSQNWQCKHREPGGYFQTGQGQNTPKAEGSAGLHSSTSACPMVLTKPVTGAV